MIHISSLVPSPGRWPGLFISALLLDSGRARSGRASSAPTSLSIRSIGLSDLFVVYNEQRLTGTPVPINDGRGLIVKYTHMLAF